MSYTLQTPIVIRITELRIQHMMPITDIVKTLIEEGFHGVRGGRLTVNLISYIIRSITQLLEEHEMILDILEDFNQRKVIQPSAPTEEADFERWFHNMEHTLYFAYGGMAYKVLKDEDSILRSFLMKNLPAPKTQKVNKCQIQNSDGECESCQ